MQRVCVLRIAGRWSLKSFSVEYKAGNQSLFECKNRLQRKSEVDMPLHHFRRKYEPLSQFERGRIIGMMEAGWSVRRVARQLGRSDCVVSSSDDNRVRVWRPSGERFNHAFALQRYTAPTAGVMVWGAIAYNTWSPLVLIIGIMTSQRYVQDILQPHVLPLMQRLPGAIFQQDNAWPHMTRVSQDCLRPVITFPCQPDPQIFLPLSISGIIWDCEWGIP
ncbi:uncharacterized protein TNCV_3405521 [Trichonephila clavipes]|nr:uncharacterized protein TNCV_3405521 [Trichonephila clavipes]